jgi:hypothetical protein
MTFGAAGSKDLLSFGEPVANTAYTRRSSAGCACRKLWLKSLAAPERRTARAVAPA